MTTLTNFFDCLCWLTETAQHVLVVSYFFHHCCHVGYHKVHLHNAQCTIMNGQNWEGDALLTNGNGIKEINRNIEWFLLWFWGAFGWLRLSLTLLQLLNHIYDTSSFASWQKLKIQKRKSLTVSQKVLPPIEKDCKSKIENLINRILTLLEFREI